MSKEGAVISALRNSTASGFLFLFFPYFLVGCITIIRNGEIGIVPEKLNFQRNDCSCRERPIVLSFLLFYFLISLVSLFLLSNDPFLMINKTKKIFVTMQSN